MCRARILCRLPAGYLLSLCNFAPLFLSFFIFVKAEILVVLRQVKRKGAIFLKPGVGG